MTIIRAYQARERMQKSGARRTPESFESSTVSNYQTPAPDQLKLMTEEEASQIRGSAQSQAEQIISQAHEEARQIKAQAQAEGMEQGKNQGYQTVAQTISAAQNLIKQAELERNRIVDSAKKEILALGTGVATRILHQELSINKDLLMQIIADAIGKISDRDQVIIRVNKDDLEFFKNNRDKIEDLLDGVKNLAIQADKHVDQGGLIIETRLGVVDARLETKMEVLQKALFAVYDQDAKMLNKKSGSSVPLADQDLENSALVEGALPPSEKNGEATSSDSQEASTQEDDDLNFDVDDLNLDDLDLDLDDKG